VGTGDDGAGWPQRFCVRTQRYRLDLSTRIDGRPASADQEDVFLADTLRDPAERRNVASDPHYREVRERLVRAVREHAERAHLPADDDVYAAFVPPGV
jgi:hypothetical protein